MFSSSMCWKEQVSVHDTKVADSEGRDSLLDLSEGFKVFSGCVDVESSILSAIPGHSSLIEISKRLILWPPTDWILVIISTKLASYWRHLNQRRERNEWDHGESISGVKNFSFRNHKSKCFIRKRRLLTTRNCNHLIQLHSTLYVKQYPTQHYCHKYASHYPLLWPS